jgi:hypothetical protein
MRLIRWVLKPVVFAACLLPALHIGLGALNALCVGAFDIRRMAAIRR